MKSGLLVSWTWALSVAARNSSWLALHKLYKWIKFALWQAIAACLLTVLHVELLQSSRLSYISILFWDENQPLKLILFSWSWRVFSGTYKEERIITSAQGASIAVQGGQKEVLNFCANNYLGLSNHPRLVEAAHKALDSHGFGLSSVRFICGTQDLHKELESTLSAFHGTGRKQRVREQSNATSSCQQWLHDYFTLAMEL